MKATVDTKLLAAALKAVSAASAKNGLAVLTGVRLDMANKQLRLSCTDLELEITTTVDASGTKGSAVMPAGLLTRLVGSLKAERTQLELIGDRLVVTAGSASADFATFTLDDWPQSITVEGTPGKLSADDLDRLGRIIGFASTDLANAGPKCGVRFDGNQALVTDTYRLGIIELSDTFDPPATIPATSLRAMLSAKGEDASITLGENSATMEVGQTIWTTRLIPGDYPKVGAIVDRSRTHHLTFDREELIDTIGMIAAVAEREHCVALVPGDGEAVLSSKGPDGEIIDTLACQGDFTDMIGFAGGYLTAALEAVDDDDVRIMFEDPLKPVSLVGEGITVIIMPIKVAGS